MEKIKLEMLEGGIVPEKVSPESVSYDLRLPHRMQISRGSGIIPLGFRITLPKGKIAILAGNARSIGVFGWLSEIDGQLCNIKINDTVVDEKKFRMLQEMSNVYQIKDAREIESPAPGVRLIKVVYNEKTIEPVCLEGCDIKTTVISSGEATEVGLPFNNLGNEFLVEAGQCIGQMIIVDAPAVEFDVRMPEPKEQPEAPVDEAPAAPEAPAGPVVKKGKGKKK